MSNDHTRQHLLGTWKLLSAVREEIPSGAKSDLMGATPIGYINYAPNGRMMVLNVGSERRKPAGASATSAEAEALFRSMTSYAGTYTIDGNEIRLSRKALIKEAREKQAKKEGGNTPAPAAAAGAEGN